MKKLLLLPLLLFSCKEEKQEAPKSIKGVNIANNCTIYVSTPQGIILNNGTVFHDCTIICDIEK